MQKYTPEQVRELLTQAARERGYREFRAGELVMAMLEQDVPEAVTPAPAFGSLATLTAVPIILDSGLHSDVFRLIRHDSCTVLGREVLHGDCEVVEGEMTGAQAAE